MMISIAMLFFSNVDRSVSYPIIAIFGCLGLVYLFFYMNKHTVIPTNEIKEKINKITDGDYNQILKITEKNELGEIQKAFNEMSQIIQISMRELFTQYSMMEEKEEELQRINEELENYIYIISHDLKTPVVSIEGFATLFQDRAADKLDDKSLHYLNRIQSNAVSMHKLIIDILELSRASRKGENLTKIDILGLIYSIEEEFEFFLKEQNISLIIENIDTFQEVVFEKTKMQQIFHNLISNSVKYIGNKENKKISIRYEFLLNEKAHLFQVEDTGIGIKEKDFQIVFKLFQTLNHSNEEGVRYSGTGVGLAIVKRILENYNGRIWLESKFGVGTTFYFSIPLLKPTIE